MGLALARQHINTLVPALDIQAGRVQLAMVNIHFASALPVMSGRAMDVLKSRHPLIAHQKRLLWKLLL